MTLEDTMRALSVGFLLLLVLVLGGRGADRTQPAVVAAEEPPSRTPRLEVTASLDACAVLTKADVAEVLKEEPRKPKPAEESRQMPGSRLTGSTCQYMGEGWRIRFFVERGHDAESRKVGRLAFKGWKQVPKLGDEAWWGQSDPAKPGTMTVFAGTHALVLSWFVRGGKVGPGTLENSTELVRRALGRLE
jgi:hypothetical protein